MCADRQQALWWPNWSVLIRQNPYLNLGESLMKVFHTMYMKLGRNLVINDLGLFQKKIPRRGRRQAIYFLWVVGGESFQIIWVIGVRPNLITWVVGISLHGRGRKNIICPKKGEVITNLAKRKRRALQTAAEQPFLFIHNRQNSDVSVEYW